jgi:hypothetical protein
MTVVPLSLAPAGLAVKRIKGHSFKATWNLLNSWANLTLRIVLLHFTWTFVFWLRSWFLPHHVIYAPHIRSAPQVRVTMNSIPPHPKQTLEA